MAEEKEIKETKEEGLGIFEKYLTGRCNRK